MITTGRVCVKTRGRDSGKKAVVVSILDKNNVLIDGEVRRKKCSIAHLEPISKTLNIKENASREEVKEAFKSELGMELEDKKSKQTGAARPAHTLHKTTAKSASAKSVLAKSVGKTKAKS